MILGIDVGSTHTDAVLLEEARVVQKIKTTTHQHDLFSSLEAVFKGFFGQKEPVGLKRITLSTTICTNAVVEDRLTPCGVILMTGPGLAPSELTLNEHTHFIGGYIDHRGVEAAKLDLPRLKEAVEILRRRGIRYAGIAGKFSPRNPGQEIQAAAMCESFRHVSLGHRLSGNLNYPRRAAAAYLNASLWETYNGFVTQVLDFFRLRKITAPLYILKADGGTFTLDASRDFPVQTVLSGPAASIMGILAGQEDHQDLLALDIGGTTTDIALFAAGVPLLEPLGVSIAGRKTCIRGLRTRSVGLGGDSRVSLEEGRLCIGPRRDGPAAALGGPSPTPTDAMIVLGLINMGSAQRAAAALKPLADAGQLSLAAMAEAIVETTCLRIAREIKKEIAALEEQPVYTIHEFLLERKLRPKVLVVVGGPAEILAPRLGALLNYPYSVPPDAEVANALGAALSRTSLELTLLADTERRVLTLADEGRQIPIPANFSRQDARKIITERLREMAQKQQTAEEDIEIEMVEDLEYPMIRDQYRTGRNIRQKAQLKPGLTRVRGEEKRP